MKRKLFLVLIVSLLGCYLSSAFAASTFKRVNANPFYRPPLTSEADLKSLVKSRNSQLKTGFAKAGDPNLYQDFSRQFPTATIDSIKVFPGETFKWMFFRKKGAGPVIVTKDVTWGGAGPLDAYRFYIDSKGKRYEFAVLSACGNFALRNVTDGPSAKTTSALGKTEAPPAKPSTPDKAAAAPPAQKPEAADSGKAGGAAGPPAPMPASSVDRATADATAPTPSAPADRAAAVAPAPIPAISADRSAEGTPSPSIGTTESGAAGSVTPTPGVTEKASAGSAASTSTAKFLRGTVVDTGFSYQDAPASNFFVRMGYEFPLFDKLGLIAALGGYFRVDGYEGGTAVVADAILDYHWWNRLSLGVGAGYWWTGKDGQMDLTANIGVLVYEKPDIFNTTLFLEARSAIDKLDHMSDDGRFGLGIRFRF